MRSASPLEIENPEFTCNEHPNTCMGLESKVAISSPESGYKSDRFSTLTFRVDNIGGYPMEISVRPEASSEWTYASNIGEICIRFAGDYEAEALVDFLKHAGQMAKVVYPEYEPIDVEGE